MYSSDRKLYEYSGTREEKYSVFVFLDVPSFKHQGQMDRFATLYKIFKLLKIEVIVINSTKLDPVEFSSKFPVFEDPSQLIAKMFGVKRGGNYFMVDRSDDVVVNHGSIYGVNWLETIEAIVTGGSMPPYEKKVDSGEKFKFEKRESVDWESKIKYIVKFNCIDCHKKFSSEASLVGLAAEIKDMIYLKGSNIKKSNVRSDHRLLPSDEAYLLDWVSKKLNK